MAKVIRPIAETSNEAILDAIRNEQSPAYQHRIPSATQAGVRATLEALQGSSVHYNAFYDALMNRIGGTYVNQQLDWDDPFQEFNRAAMQYGDTQQEIAVGLVKAHVYNPQSEYLSQDNFGTFKVPVDSVYHTQNYQHWYAATVQESQVRQAFLDENGLGQLVAQTMAAPKTSDQLDTYLATCRLFPEYARLGGYWRVQVPDVAAAGSTKEQGQTLLRAIRSTAGAMAIRPQTQYNARHWPSVVKPDDLMLIITPQALAGLDVMALADLFNADKADIKYRIIQVLPEDIGITGYQAILTTKQFFYRYDNLREVTNQRNAVSLGQNYYLHHWMTLSVSPFAPAALFWTGEGSKITVINPDKVTASTPEFELHLARYTGELTTPTNVSRGGLVQLMATLTNSESSDPNAYQTKGIQYTLGDTKHEKSRWTRVDQTGMLHVGIDEANDTIPVHAKATYVNPDIPEVDMETSADLEVPVVGEGTFGFNPQLLVSFTLTNAEAKVGTTKLNFEGVLTDSRKVDVSNMVLTAVTDGDATIDGRMLTANSAGTVKLSVRLMGMTKDVEVTVTA